MMTSKVNTGVWQEVSPTWKKVGGVLLGLGIITFFLALVLRSLRRYLSSRPLRNFSSSVKIA